MNYAVKKYMGLAMLCAANRGIPIGNDINDADARIKVEWDGELVTFTMYEPESKYEYFSCKFSGEPSPADSEDIIRLAFNSNQMSVPYDVIQDFIEEYEKDKSQGDE